jgi:hypothetical protein
MDAGGRAMQEQLPRRIKIRKNALFDPLILTFSRWEKGLFS